MELKMYNIVNIVRLHNCKMKNLYGVTQMWKLDNSTHIYADKCTCRQTDMQKGEQERLSSRRWGRTGPWAGVCERGYKANCFSSSNPHSGG